jgi:Caspase domain
MQKMKRKAFLVCAIAFAAALFATVAEADRRVALVIGNSAYRNATSLPNTLNDANAVAALFRSVGFEVVNSRTDLGVLDFKRAVRDFLITAESADTAVVYYAGHGIEVGGTNYLIPVDAKLARDYDVQDEAVALDRIIWALQSVKRLRLILLDACRDNPFVAKLQRSVGIRAAAKGGLAKIDDVSADTLVAYAAKAGSFSYDGDGADSPFASALLKHVAEPGLDIRIALGRVRDEVLKTTGGRQEPFIYGSLGGATIPLVPLPPKKIEPAPAPPAVAAREPAARPNAAVAPTKVEPAKAPLLNSQAAVDRTDPALVCGRDEQRLARLRSDPVPDEIARFSHELSCERLRLQDQRLFESVATGPAAEAAPSAAPLGATAPADAAIVRSQANSRAALDDPAVACSRDELRLARLRSDPVPDEIARFRGELSCDRLRLPSAALRRPTPSAGPSRVQRGSRRRPHRSRRRSHARETRKVRLVCAPTRPSRR